VAPQNLSTFCARKEEASQKGSPKGFPIQKMRNVLARSFLTRDQGKNHAVNKLQLNFQSSRGEVGRNGRLYQHRSNRRWTKFFLSPTLLPSRRLSRGNFRSKSHFRRICESVFVSFLPAISRRWPRFFSQPCHGTPRFCISRWAERVDPISACFRTSTFVKAKFRSSLLIERVIRRRRKAVR